MKQAATKKFLQISILFLKTRDNGFQYTLKEYVKSYARSRNSYLFIFKIWDTCCVCISPFGITPDRLPCECPVDDCGYQYCVKCVQSIKACNSNNDEQFYCLYCQHSSKNNAQVNDLLIDLLWTKYSIKYGVDLLSSINMMPGALSNDISSRIIHVQHLIETFSEKIYKEIYISEDIQSLIQRAGTFIRTLKTIKRHVDELIFSHNDDQLNQCFTNYCNELKGDRENARQCENFIELCELLLNHIQNAEFKNFFPSLNEKIITWENTLLASDQFQPKAIDVFKSLENDLGLHIIPGVPCRIGLIGETNAGKTSLILSLRGIEYDYGINFQSREIPDRILSSPIGVHKSTYCQLEFEHQYDDRKVIFVDIEGSTDNDLNMKSGNYFDQIKKADCDLYIIVFEHNFTDVHRSWQQYILTQMNRTCWIVRSKVDELFIRTFKQDVGQDFSSSDETIRKKYADKIVERVRKLGSADCSGKEISDIYLIFNPNNVTTDQSNSSILEYAKFDLEKLINDIKYLPSSFHEDRLTQMSVNAVARVINTCFRRGYALNAIKYKILAGIAAAIPFLDLIPRYFAREHIRQKFGVNTHMYIKKWWTGETDEFQDYLKLFDIEINESSLKTSALKSSFRLTNVSGQEGSKNRSTIAAKTVTGVAVASASLSDEAIKTVGVGSTNALRVLSVGFMVAGVVLTAGMCAWSAVSNGKQMYDYLNRLCDDLILISGYVAIRVIRSNHEIREQFADQT